MRGGKFKICLVIFVVLAVVVGAAAVGLARYRPGLLEFLPARVREPLIQTINPAYVPHEPASEGAPVVPGDDEPGAPGEDAGDAGDATDTTSD